MVDVQLLNYDKIAKLIKYIYSELLVKYIY